MSISSQLRGDRTKKKSGFSKTRNDRQTELHTFYVISEVEFIVNKSVTIASLVSVLLSGVSLNFNTTNYILVGKMDLSFGSQNRKNVKDAIR